jgi:hypothetical protein
MSTLKPGQKYDLRALAYSHCGWTAGDGTSTLGYDAWWYFDNDGVYLGPDMHGIEPLFDEPATPPDPWR